MLKFKSLYCLSVSFIYRTDRQRLVFQRLSVTWHTLQKIKHS